MGLSGPLEGLTITVIGVNDAPVAGSDEYTVRDNALLDSASDADTARYLTRMKEHQALCAASLAGIRREDDPPDVAGVVVAVGAVVARCPGRFHSGCIG